MRTERVRTRRNVRTAGHAHKEECVLGGPCTQGDMHKGERAQEGKMDKRESRMKRRSIGGFSDREESANEGELSSIYRF
ncbi:hypothetical protein KSP39_PZI019538 [Platanthera zijinensis]|uniref:Uncharacterized protein n=1 Tax=Platanthera zijinensis TaxID=2320716 RepID=A0AAP0B174_9ASPA